MKKKKCLNFILVVCCFIPWLQAVSLGEEGISSTPFSVGPAHFRLADLKSAFNRILQVSLFQGENEKLKYTLKKRELLARAISSFQPSLVSGLLYVADETAPHPEQVEAFCFLRKEIMATNPRCKFDVRLNVTNYKTIDALISKLQEINAKVSPDIVLLVIPKNNEVVYPSILAKGIEYIHAHGQAVGYEGPTSMIPDGVDFLVIRAENGEVHREEIISLRTKHHLSILVRINKLFCNRDLINSTSSGSAALKTASKKNLIFAEQIKLLTRLAEEQNAFGYHLIYPIFSAMNETQHDFQESPEGYLLVRMRALMTRFN